MQLPRPDSDFPFPDSNIRRRLWRSIFPARCKIEKLDYNALGEMEFSGGEIRSVALQAAFLAAAQGSPVDMSHITQATRRECEKIERAIGGSPAMARQMPWSNGSRITRTTEF